MQKLKQKELQQLRQKQERTKQAYKQALENLMNDQALRIVLKYCHQNLKELQSTTIQNIVDYSPVVISRLVFDKELKMIKQQLDLLPEKQCPMDHFIAIMLKVVKFPFQKTPLYLMGIKEMFNEMKQSQCSTINYEQISDYIMGQVVSFNDQDQLDTEFEIHYAQNKMQDFLMHDNGIKKIIYSKDIKKYLVLDQGANLIKIYDLRMKIVAKFEPNKQKHNKKRPSIINFDYNEMGSKLGISMSDKTFSIVNMTSFFSMSKEDFKLSPIAQVVYKSSSPIIQVYFLAMMNKWLTINQDNQLWVYDVEKTREEHEQYRHFIKHPNDDYEVKMVLEVVPMATVAFVLGNQVHFYNETVTKKKFKKFSHCQTILDLKYCQQKNQFYLRGKEQKYLTIFTLNKSTGQSKIWYFRSNREIKDFELFPFYNSLVLIDDKYDVKVFNQGDSSLHYQLNYQYIVKRKKMPLNLVKISKNQFVIHATYILVMELNKVAIQRDIDFNFLNSFYLEQSKDELYFSVNSQIMSLSLLHGVIRKNLAIDNSNLDKHKAFFLGKKTKMFVIDQSDSLFQIYPKTDAHFNQNKNHRKASGIINMTQSYYDQQFRTILMLSNDSVYQVRNDSENNFTVRSTLLLEKFPKIVKWTYCPQSRYLWCYDSNNLIYQMMSTNYQIKNVIKFNFPKENVLSQRIIVDIAYDSYMGILMLFTNLEELFIVSQHDPQRQLYVNIKEVLPAKLRQITKFKTYSYQRIQDKNQPEIYIYAFNENGFLAEIKLRKSIINAMSWKQPQPYPKFIPYVKDTHQMQYHSTEQNKIQIPLKKDNSFKFTKNNSIYIKTHEKQIVYAHKLYLQGWHLLTIGADGHIKLWGQQRKLYFDLKLPLLLKIEWDMLQIQDKRNKKVIKEVMEIVKDLRNIIQQAETGTEFINYNKRQIRTNSQKIKFDHDNPINLQIDSKQLEQIIKKNETIDLGVEYLKTRTQIRSTRHKNNKNAGHGQHMNKTHRISEPWKKKKQFVKLYEKASSVEKYRDKMPFDLLLMRNDLHMTEKIQKQKQVKEQLNLTILPQLKNYKFQIPNREVQNPQITSRQKELLGDLQDEKFESCVFVKTQRARKKVNQFDEIDKYFNRKQQQILNRKWIPNKSNIMSGSKTLEPKFDSFSQTKPLRNRSGQVSKDPLKSVMKIFQNHNRQAMNARKGRIIKIPKLDLYNM